MKQGSPRCANAIESKIKQTKANESKRKQKKAKENKIKQKESKSKMIGAIKHSRWKGIEQNKWCMPM